MNTQVTQKQKIMLAVLLVAFAGVLWFTFLKGDGSSTTQMASPVATAPTDPAAPGSSTPPPGDTSTLPGQTKPSPNGKPASPSKPAKKNSGKTQLPTSAPIVNKFPGSGPVKVYNNPFSGGGTAAAAPGGTAVTP